MRDAVRGEARKKQGRGECHVYGRRWAGGCLSSLSIGVIFADDARRFLMGSRLPFDALAWHGGARLRHARAQDEGEERDTPALQRTVMFARRQRPCPRSAGRVFFCLGRRRPIFPPKNLFFLRKGGAQRSRGARSPPCLAHAPVGAVCQNMQSDRASHDSNGKKKGTPGNVAPKSQRWCWKKKEKKRKKKGKKSCAYLASYSLWSVGTWPF